MSSYRCFLFDASKLVGTRAFEDKAKAEASVLFGLRWGVFDRAEIWADSGKLVAWEKHGEELRETV